MRNNSVVDGRTYVTSDMAIKISHEQASMTDPSLDCAEHAFRTCWCVRGTLTHPSF